MNDLEQEYLDLMEYVDLLAPDFPHLARNVVAAFVDAGLEPPTHMGFTAQDNVIIKRYYDRVDPNGSQAARKREADEEVC